MSVVNLFDLSGKVAAVIGAGSGIGEAVALGCASYGAHVVCLDLNEDAARRVAAGATAEGRTADAGRLDVTDAPAVDRAFGDIRQRHGALDIVVCTPAINVRKKIL